MRRPILRVLLLISGALVMSCDRQSVPLEPTESLPVNVKVGGASNGAAVHRQSVGFSLSATDFSRGLSAHVTSGPSVLENCGAGEFSEQTDFLEVVQPNGVVHSRLLGRDLSVGVWLEPLADICSVPFAVGEATATLVQKDLENVGPGAQVLSWRLRGSVTALEGGQRYRVVITIHQIHRPDGTLRANRSEIRMIPVGR
jgi:hypothetical protein